MFVTLSVVPSTSVEAAACPPLAHADAATAAAATSASDATIATARQLNLLRFIYSPSRCGMWCSLPARAKRRTRTPEYDTSVKAETRQVRVG
jgi:hypothetical protein